MPEITSLNLKEYPKPELPIETQEFKKKGFWEKRIPRRLKEKVVAGAMLGMTLLGPNSVEAQSLKGGPKKETTIGETKDRDWDIHWSLTAKAEDGRIYINPFGILPQVEVVSDKKETKEIKFELPYEYSRLFDTGKPLSPEDHQKLAEYIEGKLRGEFGIQLHDLLGSDDLFRAKHGNTPEKVKVTDIKVTGFASPEGPRRKGPMSITPGAVDSENVGLAKKRAETGATLTDEALQKLGVTREQLDATIDTVGAEELQFSSEEMAELEGLATGENGIDPLEKIFNLIVKYNDGAISDAKIAEALDRIVGSKRKIEVAITYEDGQQDVYLFMIPWVVLLPLLRRRRGGETPPVIPPPGKEPLRLPGLVIPPKFKEVNLSDPESQEYKDMEERSSIDDLYTHFGNPETIRKGLDYQSMMDNLYFQYDEFPDEAAREEFLSAKILQAWKDHDRAARKEAGVSEEELDKGLDYENQDNQIKWAKMHGRKLAKLVSQKKEFEAQGKEYSYMELMTPEVVRLLKRRNGESELGAPAEPDALDQFIPEQRTQPEQPVEAKESWAERKKKYFEALRAKREVLKAFIAMNAARGWKKLSELSADARAKYEELKKAWIEKRDRAAEESEKLPVEDQERLASANRLTDIDLQLAEAPEESENLAGETRIKPEQFDEPGSEVATESSVPPGDLTLEEIERRIKFAKDTGRVPGVGPEGLAYWEQMKAEHLERQRAAQTEAEVVRLEENIQNIDRQLSEKHRELGEIEKRVKYNKDTGRILESDSADRERVLKEIEQLEWERDALEPRLEQLQAPAAPGWTQRIREAFTRRSATPEQPSPTQPPVSETGSVTQPEAPEASTSRGWSVWGWLKERGKGFMSLGVWEVRQGIRFQKGTKETAKDAAELANQIKQERDLNMEDAQDEANQILAAMREQNIDSVRSGEFWKISNEVSEKKRNENIEKIDSITAGAIVQLKEKVAKYRGQATAESVLTPDRLKDVELALKRELAKMTRTAEGADARNLAKLMRENLDKYWWLRYIYGPLEASILGYLAYSYVPWSRMFGSPEDLIPSGGGDFELPGGDERMMDKNLWAESKELLQEQGIENPTNAEIQQVDTALAQENNIKVVNPTTGETLWQETGGGETSDRSMLKGLIKSSAGNKVALAIKVARIAAGAF